MKYTATSVVTLALGAEVGLTKEQSAARRHCTEPMVDRKNWFIVTAPIQFKAGEAFLYEGDLPKHLADAAEPAKKGPSKADLALEAARGKVADCEKKLAVAQSDDDKAAAEAALRRAQAELADLKG